MRRPSFTWPTALVLAAALLAGCSSSGTTGAHTTTSIPLARVVYPGSTNWATAAVPGTDAISPPHYDGFYATITIPSEVSSWYTAQLTSMGWKKTASTPGVLGGETFVKGHEMFIVQFQQATLPASAFDNQHLPANISAAGEHGVTLFVTRHYPTAPKPAAPPTTAPTKKASGTKK